MKREGNKVRIGGYNYNNNLVFSKDLSYVNKEDIQDFYLSLKEKGLYEEYVESLNKLFITNKKEEKIVRFLKKNI